MTGAGNSQLTGGHSYSNEHRTKTICIIQNDIFLAMVEICFFLA